ncbi:MAG: hypothetical protein JW863_11505 [Chitinispirillaceae bacterium]|nr:hypothetical protein [Chitinispirillaceae bacterium]
MVNFATGGNDTGSKIKAAVSTGKIPLLRLDFPRAVSRGAVRMSLFDESGRLVTTLFAGQLSFSNLMLPLNRDKIGRGVYVLKVSHDNTTSEAVLRFAL